MKITANRDQLLGPLLQVGNVVERRQTLPILANVLLSVRPGELTLTATDLEVELKTRIGVGCEGEGEFTLPARKLIDICKALPEGAELSLALEGEKAVLRSGRGRYTLGLLPAQDYPTIEPSAPSEILTLSEGLLKRLIARTHFAMAQQDVRYYLNGMLLEIQTGRLRAVATDGHRLAMCTESPEGGPGSEIQIIVPRKAVLELSRLLSETDGEIRVEVSPSHIRVNREQTSFISKLIDGKFPDYERVMPMGEAHTLVADRELLRQSLARTAILSNEKYRGIRFRVSSGLLHLQAHNPEQDEAEEEIEVIYTGPEMTIGFNVGYLLDVLGAIDTDQIRIDLVDANSSTLVMPEADESCRYVIMPMRL